MPIGRRPRRWTRIPADAVAPLFLLIEAAAIPNLVPKHRVLGSKLEREEALDALDYGGILLPHLVWEWAAYAGLIRLNPRPKAGAKRAQTVDSSGMYTALGALEPRFRFQFSMPLPPRNRHGPLLDPAWPGWSYPLLQPAQSARVQLVERTDWIDIGLTLPSDIDPEDLPEPVNAAAFPVFGEPAIKLTSRRRVGEVWVRLDPRSVRPYRRNSTSLLELLAVLQETRLSQLRQVIASARPRIDLTSARSLNAFLQRESQLLDVFRTSSLRLKSSPASQRRRLTKRLARIASDAGPQGRRPPTIFVSYSHSDSRHRTAIQQHLSLLEREGRATIWWDERISAGARWEEEIALALRKARIVLLLVSRHYLSSKSCYEKEMAAALGRAERGRARVIPVILGPCDWKRSALGRLLAVPKNGRPVTRFRNRDDAYVQIVEAVEGEVARIARRGPAVS